MAKFQARNFTRGSTLIRTIDSNRAPTWSLRAIQASVRVMASYQNGVLKERAGTWIHGARFALDLEGYKGMGRAFVDKGKTKI